MTLEFEQLGSTTVRLVIRNGMSVSPVGYADLTDYPGGGDRLWRVSSPYGQASWASTEARAKKALVSAFSRWANDYSRLLLADCGC